MSVGPRQSGRGRLCDRRMEKKSSKTDQLHICIMAQLWDSSLDADVEGDRRDSNAAVV